MASALLLDREFLNTLEQVALLCSDDLAGGLGADRRSRFKGPGLEFADYRGYSTGEDARSLDWNAFLRLGKLFLKVYALEQNITVRILVDASVSMDCEPAAESKFTYAQRLAATFAYLALLRLDTAVVLPFGERLGKPLVVSGGRNHFWPVLEYLNTLSCDGGTDLVESVKQFLERFPTPGMVIVISDFFDEPACTRAVEMLARAVRFRAPAGAQRQEQRPTVSGELLERRPAKAVVDAGQRGSARAGVPGIGRSAGASGAACGGRARAVTSVVQEFVTGLRSQPGGLVSWTALVAEPPGVRRRRQLAVAASTPARPFAEGVHAEILGQRALTPSRAGACRPWALLAQLLFLLLVIDRWQTRVASPLTAAWCSSSIRRCGRS